MQKFFPLFIATRYTNFGLRRHFISFISLTSMLGIAFGVMVLITVMSVMNGFETVITERMLNISPHITLQSWFSNVKDWRNVEQLYFENLKDIKGISPYIEGNGMLINGKYIHGVVLNGILPQEINKIFPLQKSMQQGSLDSLEKKDGSKDGSKNFNIVLGTNLAQSLRLKIGDNVTVVLPQTNAMGSISPVMKKFVVSGIFAAGYQQDSYLAFINLMDARKLLKLKEDEVTGIQISLSSPLLAPKIANHLKNTIAEYHISDWTEQNVAYVEAARTEKRMMFLILLLLIGIATFNLVSTLFMIVTDKRANIALFRALGASTLSVMSIFILQGAIIGGIGTILGAILGIYLSHHVTEIAVFVEKMFNIQFFATGSYYVDYIPADLQLHDVYVVCICAIVLSLLATIYPAYRAAKVNPARALHYE